MKTHKPTNWAIRTEQGIPAAAFFKTSPMFDSIEIVRAPEPPASVRCECGHLETQHAEDDYDFDGERYVSCPRPCHRCECTNFWDENA